jgi:murein L,D-transpeptidase YafK
MALAGCDTDGTPAVVNGRHMQPLSERLLADFEAKNMEKESAILVRIFKEESELEVWKEDKTGRFALLRTYPICRWSGDLGPKIKEGDRQAPEGFYTITPGLMNPNSNYYLAINTGFPNAYDQANGRTGGFLMIHGDCSSRGCYAMTDEQIAEIYALGRESFFGGQKAFQFEAFPFHMTPINMAKHRNNPAMPFWRMIKEGYDHFEITHQEPKVDFCEKHYVFDAVRTPNAKSDPVFNASAKCPAYVVPDELAEATRQKQEQDDAEFNKLASKGVPMAKLNTGIDGGMNQIFASHVPGGNTGLSDGGEGQGLSLLATSRAPGTIPGTVNPPHLPGQQPDEPAFAGAPAPAAPAKGNTKLAAAAPAQAAPQAQSDAPQSQAAQPSDGFFSSLARKVGLGSATADTTASTTPAPDPAAKPSKTAAKPKAQKPAETKTAESKRPPLKPSVTDATATANAAPAPAAAPQQNNVVAGAQPILQTNSFGDRFSAVK